MITVRDAERWAISVLDTVRDDLPVLHGFTLPEAPRFAAFDLSAWLSDYRRLESVLVCSVRPRR